MTVAIYNATRSFPREEVYGLSSQLRRAAISVPSNIAEGYGRYTKRDYRQFLGVARGSNLEVQTQLIFARKLGFGLPADLAEASALSKQIDLMLCALIKKLSASI